jgi:hypothetical protein
MNRLLLTALITATLAVAADPFVGTWKPVVEKSRFSPGGGEFRKTWIVTFESTGKDSYREIATTADGKPIQNGPGSEPLTWAIDGKEHAFGSTTAKTERINDHHLRRTVKSDKGTAVEDYVVADEGKTMTLARKGRGASSGRTLNELIVYERQK